MESQECRTDSQEVCETVTDMTCLAEVCTSLTTPDCTTVWSQQCSPFSPSSPSSPSSTQYPRLSSPSRDLTRQTFQASIQEVKNVPKVVSVTSFRDPTKSSSIIDRWILHNKQTPSKVVCYFQFWTTNLLLPRHLPVLHCWIV